MTTYTFSTPYTYISYPGFSVRPAEGGWIVMEDGKEYVIVEAKQLLNFLKPKDKR